MGVCITQASSQMLEHALKVISRQGEVLKVYEDIATDSHFIKCDLPQINQVAEGARLPFVEIIIHAEYLPEFRVIDPPEFRLVVEVE